MKKRGQIKLMTTLIFIVLIIIFAVGFWIYLRIPDEGADETNETGIQDVPSISENASSNESNQETNITSENNQSASENITSDSIPEPIGSITMIDTQNDNGGYFCNESNMPKHGLRVYTYKIINGEKNLSENYIESDKSDNICPSYPHINISIGMKYDLEWRWDSVKEIDGYRAYHYYHLDNITRNYDHYVDVRAGTEKIIDTGLDLWVENNS